MNKLKKMAPAWHAEALEILRANCAQIHDAFVTSTKRAVWLGIFLNEIKRRGRDDKSIPHGTFGPWLKDNFPQMSWNLANTYMRLGREICEKGDIQIVDFHNFAHGGELPAAAEKLIEGKTQQQLFLEFKQIDEESPDRAKRGRARGEGGSAPRIGKTVEETVELNKARALRQMGLAADALERLHVNFLSQPDAHIAAFLGALERSARCARQWLATPPAQRDITKTAKLWKTKE